MAFYIGSQKVCPIIKSGGSGSGDGITREVSAQGVYQMPASSFTFSLPSNATDVSNYALYSAFRDCTGLISIDLSSLTTISGSSALSTAFRGCTSLTSVDLSSLTTVSGSEAFSSVFYNCTSLTSIDLSSLTTISGSNAFSSAFSNCAPLTSIDLSSLTTLSGSYALQGAFEGCTHLTTLSFPALTSTSFGSYTNQFKNMLYGVTGCTVHFPSNLQSVIGNWSLGGNNTIILFDLPATT